MSNIPISHAPGCAIGEFSMLMQRLRGGDYTALSQLYDATAANVYARVLRVTGNTSDAEQVTCDVYRQLWQHAQGFESEHTGARQWLMDAARSRALDFVRTRAGRRKSVPVTADHCAGDISSALEGMLRQRHCLSPSQARLLALFLFDGLSHPEIASCTNVPVGLVKASLCRAVLLLRKALLPQPPTCVRASRDPRLDPGTR
jgi:RNA polymerase sigma factor (sigma-70 family)